MADELNFQIPREGYDSYLYGIIPDDQAVLAGAFSTSMQQIRNIENVNLSDFAKVAFSIESTVGLPLTGGTDIPTDTPLSTAAKIKTALGSGVYGTYTMSNFFGAMSGLPYPWENIYNSIKQLETANLRSIYQNLYLAVKWETATVSVQTSYDPSTGLYTVTGISLSSSGGGYGREPSSAPTISLSNGGTGTTTIGTDPNDLSTYGKVLSVTLTSAGSAVGFVPSATVSNPLGPGWPGMNTIVQGYIDAANNEIYAIQTANAVNFQAANLLNNLWNITGIALKHEQRARYIAIPPVEIPYDDRASDYPTALYVFVDSIPDLAKQTLPHMAAQTLEHISDLNLAGGQSIVAMMRQERNQDRLAEIGIELDNNLNNSLDENLKQQLAVNGVLCGAVEGIESENGCIYTLPAWPNNTEPYAYFDGDTKLVEKTVPGNILTLLIGDEYPIVNPKVPVGPGPVIDSGLIDNTPNFQIPDPLPVELDTTYTGTPLLPSSYNVNDAIDKVIECNCDCWI